MRFKHGIAQQSHRRIEVRTGCKQTGSGSAAGPTEEQARERKHYAASIRPGHRGES